MDYFLITVSNTIPTLWAGTNNGTVFAFTISVPPTSRRSEDNVCIALITIRIFPQHKCIEMFCCFQVTCQLAKEIQLKHRAPVIGITVLDGSSVPLPEPLEVI